MEIFHYMEIFLYVKIIQDMEVKHHALYRTTIGRRKKIYCQVYIL